MCLIAFSFFNPLGRTAESHCLCGDSLQVNVVLVKMPFLKLNPRVAAFSNCCDAFVWVCSEELEKPVPSQPGTNEIIQAVLKECCRENPKYKIVAISCAADVLKATKEDRFQEFSDIVIPLIKKVMTTCIFSRLVSTSKIKKERCFFVLFAYFVLGLV